jgi:uncharacterized protein (TIGR03067 family)
MVVALLSVVMIIINLHSLNGSWKIVKIVTVEGEDLPKMERVVTFQNGNVVLRKGGPLLPFRINPLASPKWIDVQLEDNTDFPGIYELEGDRLKIYLITESVGKRIPPRPKSFKDNAPGQFFHLERVKKE